MQFSLKSRADVSLIVHDDGKSLQTILIDEHDAAIQLQLKSLGLS